MWTGVAWQRVSSKLVTARRVGTIGVICLIGLTGSAVVAAVGYPAWAGLTLAATLVAGGFGWWLIGRQVAAIGYLLRDDDLVVVRGLMVRRLVVVPFGRMQLIDLKAGPLERRYGITTLQLHTAAATTDAVIPGLPVPEAEGLRDRLAALGEARTAGL